MLCKRGNNPKLLAERKHYAVIRALAGQRLDAVQYLYNRLNIVDAKSASLLQVNGFILAVMTFMTASVFTLSNQGQVVEKGQSAAADKIVNLAQIAHAPLAAMMPEFFLLALVLLAISTLLCFFIFHLRFDHVSAWSDGLADQLKTDATLHSGLQSLLGAKRPKPAVGECSGGNGNVGEGSLERYEEEFFVVTIRRQDYLRWASRLSRVSGLVLILAYGDYLFALIKF